MKIIYFIIFFISLIFANADIYFDVNQDSIHVGEKTTLTITTNNSFVRLLEFPEIDVDNEDITITTIEKNAHTLKLSLQFWTDGIHNFPSIKININYKNGSIVEFKTGNFEFNVLLRSVGDDGKLRDNKINKDVQIPLTFLNFILFIIIIFTLIIIYNIFRKRKLITFQKASSIVDPLTEAMKNLDDISLPEKRIGSELEAFYIKLTTILKLFLMDKFFFNATKMTSTEIIKYLNNNNICNAALEKLFVEADLCKFAQRKFGSTKIIASINTLRKVLKELDNASLNLGQSKLDL